MPGKIGSDKVLAENSSEFVKEYSTGARRE
jgi:hypothetical protein